MLTRIHLEGYKGQHRTIELAKRNVLLGRNGLGKSAVIEGIVYALSGRVPGGKSKDEVAACFPARGGAVKVVDDQERWITRGIKVDLEKARVSEILLTEPEEAPTAVSIWDCNDALLDFRNFTKLSPNKRREFVLDLVGAGVTITTEKVRSVLVGLYAKEIGGVGADEQVILDPGRLPEKLQPIASYWATVWEYVASFNLDGAEASGAFNTIVDIARRRKNEARTSSKDASAALREIEAETRGAEIATDELGRRRIIRDIASEKHAQAAARVDHVESIKKRIERGKAEVSRLEENRAEWKARLDERPPVPAPADEPESVEQEEALIRAKADEGARLTARMSEHNEQEVNRRHAIEQGEIFARGISERHKQPIGKLVQATKDFSVFVVDNVPSDQGREMAFGELQAAVDDVAKVWREQLVEREEQAAKQRELISEFVPLLSDGEEKAIRADVDRLRREIDILKSNVARIRHENDVWMETLRSAEADAKERGSMEEELTRIDEAVKRTVAAVSQDQRELADAGDVPDTAVTQHRLDEADHALEQAGRLAGAVATYTRAKHQAEVTKIADAAWAAFERAAMTARETYVAELVKPIENDVVSLLATVGRPEVPYMELQNARGKPIFELGWKKIDEASGDGMVSPRALAALSHGEAVIFASAVLIAIARRVKGLRLLLIEADHVDRESVEQLLAGLGAIADEFDAVIVATHQDEVSVPAGWRIHAFEVREVRILDALPDGRYAEVPA